MPVSTEAVADELKELYQDVMASNLSPRQKTDALEMLAALQQYSTPEHLRKTLLGIQMKGGAEAFFRRPGGSSQDELVNDQLNLRAELKGQLNQKEQELEHFTLWERAFASSPEYRALQEQKKDIENNIRAVEDRLNRFAYGWEKGISIPDWSEVDAWEQGQLAEAAKAEQESGKVEPEKVEEEGAPEAGENTAKPRFTYEPLENKNRALNDSEVKAFVGTIIGEIGKEASEQYKKGEELTTAKAVAFVIMNCLRYQKGGYQQYNTVETVAKRYFDAFEGNGMASFTAYLEGDYTKLAKLQNNTSEKYVKTRVVPLYEAIMQAVLPILDGIDNEDFTNGARHIFSPERQKNGGRDIPDWVFSDNEVIVDSLKGYDLKIYLE